MKGIIKEYTANSISEYIKIIEDLKFNDNLQIYFRGEPKDYGDTAFQPSVYRNKNLETEHLKFREIQRFNNSDFTGDITTLDKLSRMQHYMLPTRLIDLSEDALTSLYFAVSERNSGDDCIVYLVGISRNEIKHYDSDTVLVLSNLAKLPLNNEINNKSKEKLHKSVYKAIKKRKTIKWFNNKNKSVQFLLHEIREDKSHLQPLIDPSHIFSIQCVKPKLSNQRIYAQKGAFLIFGLNSNDLQKSIPVLEYESNKLILHKDIMHKSPIEKIVKIRIKQGITTSDLNKIGITTPYIYTGLDKVADYLKNH